MQSTDHLFLVYFFYGLSFLVLGVLLIAQHPTVWESETHKSRVPLVENLWFLGMFAILHGLNEWVDISLMVETWTRLAAVMELASGFLYAMSTLCIFEFALLLLIAERPRIAWVRWLPLIVFGSWLAVGVCSAVAGVETPIVVLASRGWVRYCLGLAGGLLTCFALLSQRESLAAATTEADDLGTLTTSRRLRKLLVVASMFFAINAFLSTVMAAETSFVALGDAPQGILGELFGRLGVSSPLALFRAACAVAICFAVFNALLAIDREQNRVLLFHQLELQDTNRRLQESYDRLKETQQQLVQSEKMSAVGTLVSGIAHEFNNILSGLKGYTQLARASNDLEQVHSDLEVIEEAANRTIEITRNLLSWVRPERRRDNAFIDPNEVIRQAVALAQTTFSKRNIAVVTELGSVPGMPLSKAEVQDIIMNLIINASHAIDDAVEGRIIVRSQVTGTELVELTVEDNGSGIPAENLDKIFLPFFTTKGALGGSETLGTGLGLYVVYGIIKNAGGDIRVESTVGTGTKFTITLPVQHQLWMQLSAPENPDLDREAVALLGRMRVLIVEDEAVLFDALMRYLGSRTRQVAGAHNGREALRMAAETDFDLILLDLLMPGINGLETLRHLREIAPDTPVVLMTGKAEQNLRDQVMTRGAADLIRKPFEFSELAEIVHKVARAEVRRSIA